MRTEPQPDGVTLVRLHRPPLNALSQALLSGLAATAQSLAADPSVKAVVVAGKVALILLSPARTVATRTSGTRVRLSCVVAATPSLAW